MILKGGSDLDAAKIAVLLGIAGAVAAAAVLLLARFAPTLGLVDIPGGRKAHEHHVPLVGGIAIFLSLLCCSLIGGFAASAGYFLLALSVIISVGCWDDVADLSPRLKLAIQVAASAIMIWGAGVQLHTVGDLMGWRPIGLSILAIPLTVFAVVGVVNAVNMVDGLDGLAGSIALVAFAWFALVAFDSGLTAQFGTAVVMCGAIAGFLAFNLRFPWRPRARVFLGDAGSLMIGFALGWFAIDLTQGAGRTFPPIAALWVVLLPLADCVSLMARRLKARKSPFVGDAQHIHHYLLRRGLSHSQTVAVLVAISTAFGAVGYFAWKAGVPDSVLFWPFFVGFFAYHRWIGHAWSRIDQMRSEEPSFVVEDEQLVAK